MTQDEKFQGWWHDRPSWSSEREQDDFEYEIQLTQDRGRNFFAGAMRIA